MVPSTLNGVILFLVFLMPGVAYALARERHRPSRRLSAFRETAVAVLVSSIWAVAAFSLLYLSQLLNGATHALLVKAISDPTKFIAKDVDLEVGVLLGYLVVATTFSALSGTASFRRLLRFVTKSQAFDPTSSAWWVLFEQHVNEDKIVSITLEDGTWLSGTLLSWNRDSDDGQDRELTIREPLRFRAPNAKKTRDLEGQAAMSISARRIMYLSVQYRQKVPEAEQGIARRANEDSSGDVESDFGDESAHHSARKSSTSRRFRANAVPHLSIDFALIDGGRVIRA